MNEANYKEITERVLPRLGFPEGVLDGQIRDLMGKNPGKMTASATDSVGQDQMRYDVHFAKNERKPEDTNLYLNAITTTMTKPDGEVRKHEFLYFYGEGYKLEQINNIMDGRSVYKEFTNPKTGEEMRLWYAIDLNNKDDKGNNIAAQTFENRTGFNLVVEAGKLQLTDKSLDTKNDLLRSLRNGNEYLANVRMPDNSNQRVALIAMPHVNQIAAYNSEGKRVQLSKPTMQALPAGAAAVMKNTPPAGGGQTTKKNAV